MCICSSALSTIELVRHGDQRDYVGERLEGGEWTRDARLTFVWVQRLIDGCWATAYRHDCEGTHHEMKAH